MVPSTIPDLGLPARMPSAPINLDNEVRVWIDEVDPPSSIAQVDKDLSLGKRVVHAPQQAEHSAFELALRQRLVVTSNGDEFSENPGTSQSPFRRYRKETTQLVHLDLALAQSGIQGNLARCNVE
jgi:hypothetical protein